MQTFRETPVQATDIQFVMLKRWVACSLCSILMMSQPLTGQAAAMQASGDSRTNPTTTKSVARDGSNARGTRGIGGNGEDVDLTVRPESADASSISGIRSSTAGRKLIVIGFMGGKVQAGNLVHSEAQLVRTLQLEYPRVIRAEIFANRHGDAALRTVLELLDEDGDGSLSDDEKKGARIVLFGHSWGASQAVTLANRLNKLHIPVLLTIQVDSVQKLRQNDERIPPNVREAINFYQSEGLLRGRKRIVAVDPDKTKILGNHESSYRQKPVSCPGYPWYARAFMRRHIQIENDPAVWSQIEALILAKVW